LKRYELMSNTRIKHSSKIVCEQLKKIILEINKRPSDLQKKESILRMMRSVLKEKFIEQAVENLACVCDQKRIMYQFTEKKLLRYYGKLEKEMLAETNSLEVEYVLELSKNNIERPVDWSFFEWRRSGICVAYYHLQREKNELTMLEALFSDLSIRNIGYVLSQRLDNQYLREIENELTSIDEISKSLAYIKLFNGDLEDEWEDLSTHIYKLSSYLDDWFMRAPLFVFLIIKKIMWKYTSQDDSKKISLMICIDGIKYSFKGLTAITIYKALLNPYELIEYETVLIKNTSQNCNEISGDDFIGANKKDYDAMYRRLEDINNQLSKQYCDYNLKDFLKRDGYSYSIHPKYAGLIEPMTFLS
jgi:hypothetical protein